MRTILIIDDDKEICTLLNSFFTRQGFKVTEVYNGKNALLFVSQQEVDIILCDYQLGDMNGKEVLAGIKKINANIPVIIITGYTDVKAAVEVTKMGAYDYVTKPLLPNEILVTVNKALQKRKELALDNIGKKNEQKQFNNEHDLLLGSDEYILGNSAAFNTIITQVKRVAPTNFSVILYGESGCGKEVIAQTIHKNSKRANQPFVAIDCGALSKELAGSELFGHEKGSFTGAVNQKVGSLELANRGTIFLDEIVNLSYDIQVSLLRVIQERKIKRVGGITDIDIDVRIIVASNEKLMDTAKKGKFREDLFHRFNEFSIDVPPLRDRGDDILLFANHFLHLVSKELEKKVIHLSTKVEEVFMNYSWPGNLRELKNIIKRSVLLTDSDTVDVDVLPIEIVNYSKPEFNDSKNKGVDNGLHDTTKHGQHFANLTNQLSNNWEAKPITANSLKAATVNAEYKMIVEALKQANYNKSKAARILNIDRKTLYNKMEEHKFLTLK